MPPSSKKKARPPAEWSWPRACVGAAAVATIVAAAFLYWYQMRGSGERHEALALVQAQRFDEAEPALRRMFERDPNDLTIVIALATGHLASDRLVADAEPYLTRWCALAPNDAEPFKLRMDLWLRLKRRDLAIADGQRLLELDPGDDNLRKSIAWLLVAEGRNAEADDACRRGLSSHPDSQALQYLHATIQHAQGHADQAAALLVPLLASTPPYSPAALLQATMHMEASPADADKAVALLQIALVRDLGPADRQKARYLLSQALFQLKQDAKARQVLDELRREQEADRLVVDSTQQPENLQLKLHAAAALLEVGKSDQGLALLKRVLDNDANHPGANTVLADYYEKHGQADRAKHHRGIAGKARPGAVP